MADGGHHIVYTRVVVVVSVAVVRSIPSMNIDRVHTIEMHTDATTSVEILEPGVHVAIGGRLADRVERGPLAREGGRRYMAHIAALRCMQGALIKVLKVHTFDDIDLAIVRPIRAVLHSDRSTCTNAWVRWI